MKVLLVEDRETWRRLFEKVLSARGIDVISASTPKEALNLALSQKPELAIVDFSPFTGAPSYEVIKSLTELGVPVIALGYTSRGFEPEAAKAAGAIEVLEKPFTVEELVALIRKVKEEKPVLEEKTAIVLPVQGEIEEIAPQPEEELQVIELGEEPEEAVEVEAEIPALNLSQESVVEKVAQPVSQELSKELPLPAEKVEAIIREIAWEVIPEVAEKVIREEIEKLIKSRLA